MGYSVTVELKNDLSITGTLVSVDQFLNIKLDDIQVDTEKFPQMVIWIDVDVSQELFY